MADELAQISGILVKITPKKILFDGGDRQLYINKDIIEDLENNKSQCVDFDDLKDGDDVSMCVPYSFAYDKGLI